MAYITISNSFTNGTTADATQVNTNFNDVANGLSDGTKDLNVNAIAGAATCTVARAVVTNTCTVGGNLGVTGYATITGSCSIAGAVTLGDASADALTFNGTASSMTFDNGATDGGTVNFDGGNVTLVCNAAGTSVVFGGTALALVHPTVFAHYNTNSTTAYGAVATILNCEDKSTDTHDAVTTGAGAWKFEPPVNGIYQVQAAVGFDTAVYAADDTIVLYAAIDGVRTVTLDTQILDYANSKIVRLFGGATLKLTTAQDLSIYVSNSRGNTDLDGLAYSTWIMVTLVGTG